MPWKADLEGLSDLFPGVGDAPLVNAAWPDILRLRDEQGPFTVATTTSGLTAALAAAVLLMACRGIDTEDIFRIINWEAVVLIAGIPPGCFYPWLPPWCWWGRSACIEIPDRQSLSTKGA